VARNEVDGFSAGVFGLGDIASRIDANTIGNGGVGVAAVQENGALVTGDRIGVMAAWGLARTVLMGQTDFDAGV
jgi:hypothetical protein